MALPELFANSPVPGIREPIATLTEALSEAGTTIKLSKAMPASLQTAGQARLLIDNEIILVEGTASTTVTALERGADSTTKKSHLNGSSVYHLLTKESLRRAGWPERGTELPASPVDGQEYDYVADATNGVIWRFRYRSASASTHKWEFVGGSVLGASAVGGETKLASNAFIYQEITGSPSLTVPLSGVYSTTLAVQTLSLKEAAGAAEQLNFYAGISTTSSTSAFGAFITNFQFGAIPVCISYPIPSELVVGSVLKVYAGGNNFKKWGFEGVGVGLIPVRVG